MNAKNENPLNAKDEIQLFESMYATRDGGVRHLERHLQRLAISARELNFRFDAGILRKRLLDLCTALSNQTSYRLRINLSANGSVEITQAPLTLLDGDIASVLLSDEHGYSQTSSADSLLLHKTTRRKNYDQAWHDAESLGAFDMLFFNEREELTEGSRSNVFLRLDGHWWTPPVSAGLLPGVMRSVLMENGELNAKERALGRADLLRADEVIVCNALRGALKVKLKLRS